MQFIIKKYQKYFCFPSHGIAATTTTTTTRSKKTFLKGVKERNMKKNWSAQFLEKSLKV